MSVAADSFTGRVLAVLSRRSPAFHPPYHARMTIARKRVRRQQVRVPEQRARQSSTRFAMPARVSVPSQQIASIESQKAVFYRWHLENGGAVTWATHLAQHPEDADLAVRALSPANVHDLRARIDDIVGVLMARHDKSAEELRARRLALAVVQQVLDERLAASGQRLRVPEPRSELSPAEAEAAVQALDWMAGAPSYPAS